MQHAFYLDGIIHAIHHGNYSSGYSGLIYYRIPAANPSAVQSSRFGEVGTDMAFPAMASFGLQTNDRNVMISYLSVASNTFPEMRVVNCDNNMNWSESVLLRSGLGYIDTWINSGSERWGDYSTMQRKHNAQSPTVWASGCYGASNNRWRSWVSEITGEYVPPPLPEADFVSDVQEGYQTLLVNFYDSTINDPTSWSWTFEGGNPSFSSNQNPLVGYSDTGYFGVTLIASNQFGVDTVSKEDFIHVLSTDTAPIIPEGIRVKKARKVEMDVFPNPVLDYELVNIIIDNPEWSDMDISIIDIQGREVRKMYNDRMKPGVHKLTFNKLAMSAGTYIVQVRRNGEIVQHEKVIVQ
ncbi:MAG: T9SS type A sorting domain-containing protein [Salibacteraceae bacterium]